MLGIGKKKKKAIDELSVPKNLPEITDPSVNPGFPETLEVIHVYQYDIFGGHRNYNSYLKAPIKVYGETEIAIYQKVGVKKFRREIVEVTDESLKINKATITGTYPTVD